MERNMETMNREEYQALAARLGISTQILRKNEITRQSTPDEIGAFLDTRADWIDEHCAKMIEYGAAVDREKARMGVGNTK
jgi:hypothetical protein